MKVANIVVEHKGINYSASRSENKSIASYRLSVVKKAVASMQSQGHSPIHIRKAVEGFWQSI